VSVVLECPARIACGTWQFSHARKLNQPFSELKAMVELALEKGITWLDTADKYGDGESEELLGKCIDGRRNDEVFVITKVGLTANGRDGSPAHIRKSIDNSLMRLNREYVDGYLLHWPDPKVPIEDSWDALREIKESGKARFIGLSNVTVEEIDICHSAYPIDIVQLPYSLFCSRESRCVIRRCKELGIFVMAYGVLAHGLLTPKYANDEDVSLPRDWRSGMRMFGSEFVRFREASRQLQTVAKEHGVSLPRAAIQWTLYNEAPVDCAVVGWRTSSHLLESIGSGKVGPENIARLIKTMERVIEELPDGCYRTNFP